MSSYHTSELIDKFLSNDLSETEQLEFNNLIATNNEFTNEFEKAQIANQFIHQLGLTETAKKIDLLHKKKVKTKFRQTVLSTIVVALLLSSYGMYSTFNKQTKELKTTTMSSLTVKNKDTTIVIVKQEIINLVVKNSTIKPQKNKLLILNIESIDSLNNEKKIVLDSLDEDYIIRYNDTLQNIAPNLDSNNINTTAISQQTIDTLDRCGDISLPDLETQPSCIGQQNGEITYGDNRIMGGTSPYKLLIYMVGDEENFLENEELPAGVYSIKIIDVKGCTDTISNITIIEKRCVKRIDISFSPTYSEVWEYPIIAGVSDYTVIIKNTSDQIIFEKLISPNEQTEWTGQLEDGSFIQKGIYFVELRSSKETLGVGSITIIE
jgi:hypothetical protein